MHDSFKESEKKDNLSKLPIKKFQSQLLTWYQINARILPWRGVKDPYSIWISETMLQQTRVDTVRKYFPLFMQTFPTIHDLAISNVEEVLKCWQGLGYYKRALNVHKTARIIDKKYFGQFPTNVKDIITLPGIGEYASGAIASIAFNQAIPAIDGNIKRVISRIFFLTEDINKSTTMNKIKIILKKIIPSDFPGEFNQALMEIGATICSPQKPNCSQCPVLTYCIAASRGKQTFLPFKSKRKKPQIINVEIAIVKNKDRFMLIQRPDNAMLAKMWGLPIAENRLQASNGNNVRDWIEKELKIPLFNQKVFIKKLSHTFSHRIWKIDLYLFYSFFQNLQTSKIRHHVIYWVAKEELHQFPIPQAFRKCLEEYSNFPLV